MKVKIATLILVLILSVTQAFAGNGDLIVDGKLGIGTGTSAPQKPLHILGTNKNVARFETGGGNAQTLIEFVNNTKTWQVGNHDGFSNYTNWGIRNDTDGINALNISTNGNVGIRITNPYYALEVAGEVKANSTNTTSDIIYKENIVPIDVALDKVMRLDGVTFNWKSTEFVEKNFPEGKHYGVIAQQIENIIPEVVSTGSDGTKAVAYSEIIPILIEAIKEQQIQIEQLRRRLNHLER